MKTIGTVSFVTHVPENWLHPTIKKIESFSSLTNGWHFGEGVIIPASRIELAKSIHEELYDNLFTETDAFPGLAGEIRVTAYKNDYYLEFTIEEDDLISFYFEKEDEKIERLEGLNLRQALERLADVKDVICNSSESFQSNTTTMPTREDLQALRSRILQKLKEGESLLSAQNAPLKLAGHLVSTSGTSMEAFILTPQYSGSSLRTSYHLIEG